MTILSARSICLAGLLALAVAGCGGTPPAPVEVRLRFDGTPAIDGRLRLQPEHLRLQARYAAALTAAVTQSGDWLGPPPVSSLTIVDPPWHGAAASSGSEAIVLERTPWWNASGSMAPELAVARAISRWRWARALQGDNLPVWFIRGLAEYSARRAVVPIFQGENLWPGYAFLEQRYLDRFVPRFARIRLLPETDGEPLSAYHANPSASPERAPRSAGDARSLEAKAVLTLGTLERWLGRPAFDQVLAEFVRQTRAERPTLADFSRIASDVSGQDLTWFFEETLGSTRAFDYGVESLTSEPDAAGAFVTTVRARRFGDAQFTGSTARPIGSFESGRGVSLLLRFADGQQRTDYWDGRDREKTFRYRSPARAVSAMIDPDRTLLLDLEQTNNSLTLTPRARVAALQWAARWMLWLEDAILSYASLV